jgi:phosphoadenosine phosphosulfate reductase
VQLTLEGKTLDQVAIEFIRANEPPGGYYVGYSGGKDSEVTLHLVRRAGSKYDVHYNVSPIDPPQVHKFIKEWHPEVQWDYHARGFWGKKFLSRGLPMRPPVGHRWCCKYIKEAGGQGRVKLLGMRAEESANRSNYQSVRDVGKGTTWVLPILRWTTADVWQYIAEHELPYSSLYRHGFTRIGCVMCPYHGAALTRLEMKMFPKISQLWRLAANRYWQVRIDRGTPLDYKSGEDLFNWWIDR